MAKCIYCHKNITRLDTDICPYCGEKNPLDPRYQTMDITRAIQVEGQYGSLYSSRSKRVAVVLGLLLGFTGAMWFYIRKTRYGVYELLTTIISTLGLGFLFYATFMNNVFAFLIPFIVNFFFGVIFAMLLAFQVSPKDGNGELLR